MVSIAQFESSDPGVVEIVDRATLLPTQRLDVPLAIRAVRPGQATLQASGSFSDGSTRSASLQIVVRAVNHVVLSPVCGQDASGPFHIPCGGSLGFQAGFFDGEQSLAGYRSTGLVGDGLSCAGNENGYGVACVWKPSTCPASVTVTSPLDDRLRVMAATFGAGDLDAIVAQPTNSGTQWVFSPANMAMEITLRVAGKETCRGVPIGARSETPDVCTGVDGQTQWMETLEGAVHYRILREGVCRLTLGTSLDALKTAVSIPVFFAKDMGDGFDVVVDNACTNDGRIACDSGRDGVAVCRGGVWKTQTACPAGQLCDYGLSGLPACRGL